MGVEQVRAALQRWYALVTQGADLLDALAAASSPNCVVHSQNGDAGDTATVAAQIRQVHQAYPDLTLEIEHLMVTADRLVSQVTMSGTAAPALRTPATSHPMRSAGAIVVRVSDAAEIVETWPYFNPGAMLTFPPRSDPPPPPTPGGQPGTEEQSRALSAAWSRAITTAELVARIVDAAAPDCLVHATNGDLGRIDLLEEQFAIVARAFPDVTVTFEDAVFQRDRLVTQFVLTGTHRGRLGPAPATGLRLQSTGALVARVNDEGHAAEIWVYLAPGMGLIFPRSRRDGPGRA